MAMRWLGLDLGSKTIGVAISDPSGLVAQPLVTLERQDEARDLTRVAELARSHEVGGIVVGWPRRLDGSAGPEAVAAERFAEALRKEGAWAVTLWDERLTTVQAERALIAADLSRRRRRQVIDRMAAVLILQSFLDARRAREAPRGEGRKPAPIREGGVEQVDLPEERRIVTFRDENGEEHQFVVVDLVELDDRQYAIVADPDDEEEAYIFRLLHEDDGTPVLVEIEDDDEWDAVAEAWEDMVAEAEDEEYADEILGPDDEDWDEWDDDDDGDDEDDEYDEADEDDDAGLEDREEPRGR